MRSPSVRATTVAIAATWLICACKSDDQQSRDVISPEPGMAEQVDASLEDDPLSFTTAVTVDAASAGIVGDGVTDNTEALRGLLATGNRTIRIPAGDYLTGSLVIGSDTILALEPGVVIRDSGRLAEDERLINIRGENVRIDGLGARIIADRAHYTTGEQRHGVYIYGAHNVVINGLESSGQGGDGFYIGGPRDDPATDIVLRGCYAENNRRQGLSVTSARRVRVADCEFVATRGTAPEFGVDLEPNDPQDFLDDIVLLRPHTRSNRGGGIMIYLTGLDASSHPVDVTVLDHSSSDENPPLDTRVPENVRAVLRYNRQ